MSIRFFAILVLVTVFGNQSELLVSQVTDRDGSASTGSAAEARDAVDSVPEHDRKSAKTKYKFELSASIVYRKTADYQLTCDIYKPVGNGTFPAILAVHGGAWRNGSKLQMMRHAWEMASSGYVVVAINYRHAPRHPFPAQVDDCKHAIRWIRANADTYQIDANRIGAFGYSAGGHLVALLGTSDADDGLEGELEPGLENQSTRLMAVSAGGAPCEFSWIADDSQVLKFWLGGTPAEIPDTYKAASPLTYVTADDPPFFWFHGGNDGVVPVATSRKMHKALLDAGVESQHHIAVGNGHLLTFSDMSWMTKSIEFFDSHMKK